MPVFLPDIFSMIRKNRFDDGKENDMEDEVKKLPLKWEFGEEQVVLRVDSYAVTGGVYVGLLCDNGEYYEPFADTREILVRDIERLEKQLSELSAAKKENTMQTQAEKELASLVKKYSNATEVTQELADAMIESMQLHKDNSVSITFRYMDEFKAITESIEALRKEVA